MTHTELPHHPTTVRRPAPNPRRRRVPALAVSVTLLSSVALASPSSHSDPVMLQGAAQRACHSSLVTGHPVLIEFTADWCKDCKKLDRLSTEAPLAEALRSVHRVRVDVGRFDQHPDLLAAFHVGAIARWVLTRPDRCDLPITRWPVLAAGTLEPETGADSPRTAEGVAAWLRHARLQTPRGP